MFVPASIARRRKIMKKTKRNITHAKNVISKVNEGGARNFWETKVFINL